MTRYVVIRLLAAIPSIFMILVIVFLLDAHAPGDRVASILEIAGVSTDIPNEDYNAKYKAKADELHYTLPLFYFSFAPAYLPPQLHEILPLTKRATIKELAHQIKDRETAASYIKVRAALENYQSSDFGVAQLISKSLSSINLLEIKSLGRQLATQDNSQVLAGYLAIVDQLEPKPSRFVFPQFRWHGFHNRFNAFIGGLFNFHASVSLVDGRPVGSKLWSAMKWTVTISLIVLVISAFLSILISLYFLFQPTTLITRVGNASLLLIYSIPEFWLATLAVAFFTTDAYAPWLHIFPSVGIKYYGADASFIALFVKSSGQLILPIICMSLPVIAYLTKILQSEMNNFINEPFITMARAKGLSRWLVIKGHLLPNGLIPLITILSGSLPSLIAGSVIIELIFSIPGASRLLFVSISQGDWPVMLPIIILTSILTVLGYLLGDVLLALLYPKTLANFSAKSVEP